MDKLSFLFTICLVLLGPTNIIQPFAQLTRDQAPRFRKRLAVLAVLFAGAVCLFIVLGGDRLTGKYQLSLPALQLGGGLVLLLSALQVMFPRSEPAPAPPAKRTLTQIAISPLVSPVIIPPAGVAALLIFVMNAPGHPGMYRALAIVLPTVLALDFLVMFFNHQIRRIPGLLTAIQLSATVATFIQVALAFETMLNAFRALGLIATGVVSQAG